MIDDAATVRTSAASGDERAPLVLLMHGFGSDERDLAALAPQLPDALATASLRGPLRSPFGGHAWVPITRPGRPDPDALAAATGDLLDWLDAHVAPDRVVVPLGFSQGGLMATQLLRTRPERFAAAVVLAGFVQDAAQPGDAALARSRPPVLWGRGDADPVIAADAVARTEAWLPGHTTLTPVVRPGLGHAIDAGLLERVVAFLRATVLA